MSKGKSELFNDNVKIILSKEDNKVFYDNSRPTEFLNKTTGTIKTKIEADSQISIYDIMKKWCDLQQRCKDDNERFYGYYFDEATGTTYKIYRLAGVYISNVTGYDDKKEIWYPSDDEINTFFEVYINASNIQSEEK